MKVYEGNILTCDAQDHVYKYLVEDGGRIAYVGDDLPAKYASGIHVKLDDRALIPAFGDSHIHFASFATFNAGLNVSAAKSNAEILVPTLCILNATLGKSALHCIKLRSICHNRYRN